MNKVMMRSMDEVVNSAMEEYYMGFFTKTQAKESISWAIREDRPWIKDVTEVKINRKSVRILSEQVDVNDIPLGGLVCSIIKIKL